MIVEDIPAANLEYTEYNPRAITEKQREDIKASLERFGFVDPAVRNTHPDRANKIVGGNQRVKIAVEELGYETIPCTPVNLPLDQEKELNLRLNKNSGDWDFKVLEEQFEGDDLINWGFEEAELPFLDDDEEPDFDQGNLEQAYETYKNNTIKQIVLFYEGEEYEDALRKLEEVGKDYDLSNNSQIVQKLLEFYEQNKITAEDEDS